MILDLPYHVASGIRVARLRPVVGRVNALGPEVAKRSDAELRDSAAALRRRLTAGESLERLLPEAFALVREAASRHIGERHFDCQLIGGAAIHRGWIAEMEAGEGKTLTATLPAFLNALVGRGVHVVTVNDYLARRDAEWMGAVYRALGLSVGCLVHGLSDGERLAAYGADITYGTNKEFAFDYLRDQLRQHRAKAQESGGVWERSAGRPGGRLGVQREHHFAIVDEVDSILIDEARVPLIIADRETGESPFAGAYRKADEVARALREGHDYTVDRGARRVDLTTAGIDRARATPVTTPPNRPFEHLVRQALTAQHLYRRDREYLLLDGRVSIVDEFTGRSLPDRTWSLGLHQAIEAREGVTITDENRTLASITFQRYFKLYRKLSGMTGTARDARREFKKVFGLRVVTVPTNRPLVRRRLPYRVFPTWERKYQAILDRIEALNREGRPVLVGTRSVERSEAVSERLKARGIEHSVLNARNHAAEAAIIAHAGRRGAVTISTNMAGRGVDIKLAPGVADLGGLHVLGTELHEARRIDRQLGGRAGRQGDPGSYEFFLSFDDEILERWHKRLAAFLRRRAARRRRPAGPLLRALFHLAQRAVQRRHLRIRLDLIEYDKHLEEMKGHLGVPMWG